MNRKSLHSESEKNLLNHLDKNYTLTKDKLNRVIAAYYCLYTLDNCSLAVIKIHFLKYQGYNLPLNYQIYKCQLLIKNHCKVHSTPYKYLNYINKMNKIRKNDKKFCYNYDKFFSAILESNPKLNILKNSLQVFIKTIEKLQKVYNIALIEFPNSKELKDMYSSNVVDFKNINEKENQLRNVEVRQNTINLRIINTFIKDQTLFLVSGNPESFGKITFASKEFQKFIQVTQDVSNDLTIWSIFPISTCKIYENSMRAFISKCKDDSLHQKSEIFINDSKGFIHECYSEVYCTARNGSVFFIFIISFPEHEKELAIVSDQGFIYEHSTNFCEILRLDKKKKICHRFLNEFYPNLDFERMKKYKYDEIYIEENQDDVINIQFYLRKARILDQEINALYLLKDVVGCGWNEEATEFFSIPKPQTKSPEANITKLKIPSLFLNQSKSRQSVSSGLQNLNKFEEKSKRNSILIIKSTGIILFILVINI